MTTKMNDSTRQTLVVTILLCLGFAWQSSVLAKGKPPVADLLYDAYNAAVAQGETLVFNGTEKLKLSKCCKPPKTPIELTISIPNPGEWQIDAINGDDLVDMDKPTDPDGMPGTGDEGFELDPIKGIYKPKNKVTVTMEINDKDEREQFIERIEEWASFEAGEDVYLGYKKAKHFAKIQKKNDTYKYRIQFKLSLRRAAMQGGPGNPTLGSGVYQLKAKGSLTEMDMPE